MACLPHNLLVDKLFELLLAQVILVLVKVEELLGNRRGSRLIIGIVIGLEVGMLEGLFDCDTLDGVEGEELFEEVEGEIGGLGEERAEGDLLLEWQRADVFTGTARLDTIVVLHGWCSKNIENEGQLMMV